MKDLIDLANKHFGSLENALRMAGLLTPNARIARRVRARQHSPMHAQAPKPSTWSIYPKDYFLNLLDLQRKSHSGSPTPIGTPQWWERRANMQYTCSTCKGIIEKGEKYIGYKKLRPGMRGIYGYRGTYTTHYYHLFCLLKKAESEVETNIRGSHSEIDSIEKAIVNLTEEMARKKAQVEERQNVIQQAKKDYTRRTLWGRVGKWFGFRYVLWSRNREISLLEKEIAYIVNREVPERKTRIIHLRGRINNLQQQLNEIDQGIQELASRQHTA